MQLKNAASFLMIGSIVLMVHQLVKLFYAFYLGMLFFEGTLLGGILSLLAILAGVVSLVLGVSFRKGASHSTGRMTAGIFLAIVAGLWTLVSVASTVSHLDWWRFMGNFGTVIFISHIIFVVACVSLLLMGIALAGNNALRLRRACTWVIVCCCASAVICFGMSVYRIVEEGGLNNLYLLYLIFEVLSLVFPVAWVVFSFALRRRSDTDLLDLRQDEF